MVSFLILNVFLSNVPSQNVNEENGQHDQVLSPKDLIFHYIYDTLRTNLSTV